MSDIRDPLFGYDAPYGWRVLLPSTLGQCACGQRGGSQRSRKPSARAAIVAVMGNNTPSVVLIDDSAEVRELLKTQFRLSGLLAVVGDGWQRRRGDRLAHAAPARPDAARHVDADRWTGSTRCRGILTVSPETRVVMYTRLREQRASPHRALELGAAAFLEKSCPSISWRPTLDILERHGEAAPRPRPGGRTRQTRGRRRRRATRACSTSTSSGSARSSSRPPSAWRPSPSRAPIVRANRALGEIVLPQASTTSSVSTTRR